MTSGFSILKYVLSVLLPDELGVDATVAVHVGDDPTNDKQGALAAGLESWYAQLHHNLRPYSVKHLLIISYFDSEVIKVKSSRTRNSTVFSC